LSLARNSQDTAVLDVGVRSFADYLEGLRL
jgi:hypothetical protein